MTYLNTIVKFINTSLENGLLKKQPFQNRSVIEVAESFARIENNITQLLPGFVDDNGEIKYVGPDDEYSVIIYHKINTVGFGKIVKQGYGDSTGVNTNLARMSMVVFGKRNELKLTNAEMALKLQAIFPESADKNLLQQLQFKKCSITTNDVVLNNLQVFQEEYQGVGYFLKPEQFLLKLNYQIESAFLKECFTTC